MGPSRDQAASNAIGPVVQPARNAEYMFAGVRMNAVGATQGPRSSGEINAGLPGYIFKSCTYMDFCKRFPSSSNMAGSVKCTCAETIAANKVIDSGLDQL